MTFIKKNNWVYAVFNTYDGELLVKNRIKEIYTNTVLFYNGNTHQKNYLKPFKPRSVSLEKLKEEYIKVRSYLINSDDGSIERNDNLYQAKLKQGQDLAFVIDNFDSNPIVIGCNYHTTWQEHRAMRFVLSGIKYNEAKLTTRRTKRTFWTKLIDLKFINSHTNRSKAGL